MNKTYSNIGHYSKTPITAPCRPGMEETRKQIGSTAAIQRIAIVLARPKFQIPYGVSTRPKEPSYIPTPIRIKVKFTLVSGGRRASIEFWNGTFLDLFGWNNIYRELNALADSELLQVASCASNSAERSNLVYCDTDIELTSNYDNGNTLNKPNGFVYQDNNDADLFSGPSSNPINVTYDAPLTHSLWDTIPLQGDLILLSQCGGALACASIHVDPPAILVELPTPPIDDLTIPIDLQPAGPEILTGDPGFGSDPPGGSASLPAAPVPEASTWSMGLIGVGIMALVFRQRHKRAIKQASTIDVHGISEKRGASSV